MPTAPAFWWTDRQTTTARLLGPLGMLYGSVTARRMRRPGTTLPVPVLCVGNLVAGGSGKTPTALTLAALLAGAGHRPAFLSRGYGRKADRRTAAAVLRVDPLRHTAAQTGDEPLLLAEAAPTYVSADRVAAGRQAVTDGTTVVVLDDGLQNPSLTKTFAVAVVDGATGCGNGLCMPAGPLRAPLAAQWPFVDAVCIIGEGAAGDAMAREADRRHRAVLRARLEAEAEALASIKGHRLLAFAGIGRPQKFFATLDAQGFDVLAHRSFPDHHHFTAADLRALERDAAALGAALVTTGKDRVRLPPDFPAHVLPVRLRFDDDGAVRQVLRQAVGAVVAP